MSAYYDDELGMWLDDGMDDVMGADSPPSGFDGGGGGIPSDFGLGGVPDEYGFDPYDPYAGLDTSGSGFVTDGFQMDEAGNPVWAGEDPFDLEAGRNLSGPGVVNGYQVNENGQLEYVGQQSGGSKAWNAIKKALGGGDGKSGAGVPLLNALSGAGSASGQVANRKSQEAMATQGVASRESALNPFRQQLDQAGAINRLDMLARSAYSPVTMSAPSAMQRFVPSIAGGTTYTKSPEAIAGYEALERDVMAGHTAPTMTDSSNYGKSAVLNLLSAAAGGGSGTARRRATGSQLTGDPLTPSSLITPATGPSIADIQQDELTGGRLRRQQQAR